MNVYVYVHINTYMYVCISAYACNYANGLGHLEGKLWAKYMLLPRGRWKTENMNQLEAFRVTTGVLLIELMALVLS